MSIKKYKLYLIDLDGTIYNGEKEIKYAKEFIEYLNNNKIDYLFLTNNSTKEPKDVVKKLYDLGIQTSEEHVYTSSEATKAYLIKKGYKDIYIIVLTGHKSVAPPIETIRRLNIQGYLEKTNKFEQILLMIESSVKSIIQLEEIKKKNKEIEETYIESIETLRKIVEAKDNYTLRTF